MQEAVDAIKGDREAYQRHFELGGYMSSSKWNDTLSSLGPHTPVQTQLDFVDRARAPSLSSRPGLLMSLELASSISSAADRGRRLLGRCSCSSALRAVPLGGFIIARIFEEAGLPKGVLQVLPGGVEAGEAICIDPDIAMVAFTGSSAVGRRIGELAGKHLKKVQLELGGKNAVIVFEDADLDAAASAIAFGAWFHQGQICMTTGRVLARDKIVAPLTKKLVDKAQHLPVGDPMSQVALGPVINRAQVERIHAIVKDTVAAGATLAAGGTFDGTFYRPTVLTGVKPGMRAFDEEVFGPVASITPFSTEDEAVALANQSEYGLSAGVFSADVGRAIAVGNRLNTGLLHINDQTVADEPHIPFGGVGASGNGTRIGGPANWEEFTQWQWMTIKDKPGAYPF